MKKAAEYYSEPPKGKIYLEYISDIHLLVKR